MAGILMISNQNLFPVKYVPAEKSYYFSLAGIVIHFKKRCSFALAFFFLFLFCNAKYPAV